MPLPQAALNAYQSGDLASAEAVLRRALQRSPNDADALNLLGVVLCSLGKHDQAEFTFKRVLALSPRAARAHINYANMLLMVARQQEARVEFEAAIAIDPNQDAAWLGLAPVLFHLRDLEGSIAAARRAFALNPANPSASLNLASALVGAGGTPNITEALALLREAVARNPARAGLVGNYLMTLHYDESLSPQAIFEQHAQSARRFAVASGVIPRNRLDFPNPPDPDRPLRIGYLSSDLRSHVIANFIEGLLGAHNRKHFEVFAYQNGLTDETSSRLSTLADRWTVVNDLTDDALLSRFEHDKIDILVDLNGHTEGARQLLLFRRAAPVQITYLGYPNTTGLPSIDVRIVDSITDPSTGAPDLATEELVRLPRCFLQYTPAPGSPPVAPPPFKIIGHITFGCFNGAPKVNRAALALFAGALRAVPNSRLILKNRALSSPSVRAATLQALADEQIAPDRISLLEWTAGHHLESYKEVDIALDTHPYNGTTTTCESLWMGVPVVTLAGNSHVSRVSASLLTAVALPHLVAHTPSDFATIAAKLASDPQSLAAVRASLRERLLNSELGNARSMASALESVYRMVWARWCEAKLART